MNTPEDMIRLSVQMGIDDLAALPPLLERLGLADTVAARHLAAASWDFADPDQWLAGGDLDTLAAAVDAVDTALLEIAFDGVDDDASIGVQRCLRGLGESITDARAARSGVVDPTSLRGHRKPRVPTTWITGRVAALHQDLRRLPADAEAPELAVTVLDSAVADAGDRLRSRGSRLNGWLCGLPPDVAVTEVTLLAGQVRVTLENGPLSEALRVAHEDLGRDTTSALSDAAAAELQRLLTAADCESGDAALVSCASALLATGQALARLEARPEPRSRWIERPGL